MIKILERKDNISYTLVSLIMHDGDSLDCGHYVSDVFDSNTRIWWKYDDYKRTDISDFPEVVYTREIHKKILQRRRLCLDQKNTVGFLISEQSTLKIQIWFDK